MPILRSQYLPLLASLALLKGATAAQAGFSEHSLVSGGGERSYLLYVPDERPEGPIPLVFDFHGSGGAPQDQVNTSHFDQLAEREGFAVVFPAGAFTNSITARSWNANLEPGVDDLQFVRDMIEAVAGQVDIDRKRIYTSGMSGGGRISSRLACELSDVLAAAAPVAGLQYPEGCTPARPIPVITFHGQADAVNEYVLTENSRPYWRMGVETAIDRWRQANGCSLANSDDRVSQHVTLYTWTACRDNAELQAWLIDNGGHTWPGSDIGDIIPGLGVTNMDIDASELIWQFFSRHTLP